MKCDVWDLLHSACWGSGEEAETEGVRLAVADGAREVGPVRLPGARCAALCT